MKQICAIILGGTEDSFDQIERADYIIAYDRGYKYAKKNGIKPHLLVGDFDSYEGQIPTDIPVLTLPVEKDDTDTLAALRYAIGEGASQIYMYCAFGGRFDHLWGNIQAATFAVKEGASVTLFSQNQRVHVLSGTTITLQPRLNYALSVFSLTDICEKVRIKGTKYEVDEVTFTNSFPLGVSNEWRGPATISVGAGILMVVESKMM